MIGIVADTSSAPVFLSELDCQYRQSGSVRFLSKPFCSKLDFCRYQSQLLVMANGDGGGSFFTEEFDGRFLFTSESVGEGHPDKMCDQISDAILDAHLEHDPEAKVACETVTKTGMVMILGEITSHVRRPGNIFDSLILCLY